MKTLYGLMIDLCDIIEGVCLRVLDKAGERRKKARERWIKYGGLDGIKEG